MDAIAHPHLKLAFDTYHLGHDPRVLDEIARVAPHIAIVHLGDSRKPPTIEQSRQRLCEGILPLRQIVAALQAAGYDGDYDVELMGEDIERMCYRELLQDCRLGVCRVAAGLAEFPVCRRGDITASTIPAESVRRRPIDRRRGRRAARATGPAAPKPEISAAARGQTAAGLVDQRGLRRFLVLVRA